MNWRNLHALQVMSKLKKILLAPVLLKD